MKLHAFARKNSHGCRDRFAFCAGAYIYIQTFIKNVGIRAREWILWCVASFSAIEIAAMQVHRHLHESENYAHMSMTGF